MSVHDMYVYGKLMLKGCPPSIQPEGPPSIAILAVVAARI